MRIFSIIILVFVVFSCKKKEIVIPPDVLNQKQMTTILTDIHLAQAAVSNTGRLDSASYMIGDYLNYILKKNNTNKEKLQESLKFYSDHPEMLQVVYDSVLTSLSKIESDLQR